MYKKVINHKGLYYKLERASTNKYILLEQKNRTIFVKMLDYHNSSGNVIRIIDSPKELKGTRDLNDPITIPLYRMIREKYGEFKAGYIKLKWKNPPVK